MDNINKFLHFGYAFDSKNLKFPWNINIKNNEVKKTLDYSSYSYEKLVDEGVTIFKKVFKELVDSSNYPQIVPLSGGLDSRAILGGLLENTNKENIRVVSFGVPGNLDFEIPKKIVKKFEIEHHLIDLSSDKFEWNEESLISFMKDVGRALPVFDTYINHFITSNFGDNYIYWSGFMGDPLAGSHLGDYNNSNWNLAVNRFVDKSNFSEIELLSKEKRNEIKDSFPKKPLVDKNILSYGEQLDFSVRQNSYVKHTVINSKYNYKTPFNHPLIVSFMLKVPNEYRKKCVLYKDILKKAYLELFSIPTKTTYNTSLFDNKLKLFIRRSKIHTVNVSYRLIKREIIKPSIFNYFNFDEELRKESSFKNVVFKSIKDLDNRSLVSWINIDDIWKRHQSRKNNFSKTLMLLASLEINIKAENIKL
jgi:hypothetical protein